jgi:hypothetical protein
MSKTIKNVKLTTRQWELLVEAVAYYEHIVEEYIDYNYEGYSHKTVEAYDEMRDRLGAYISVR